MAANYMIKKDISTDEFTTNRAYGAVSSLADDFGLVAEWNHPIKRLTLYVGRDSILRIRLEKMDNTYITVGACPSDVTPRHVDWNFTHDERFTEIKIYLDSSSRALVGLKMVTNKQSLEMLDSQERRKYDSQDVPVGSGMCMGMFGNAERTVTALGFAMLKELPSQEKLRELEQKQQERQSASCVFRKQ